MSDSQLNLNITALISAIIRIEYPKTTNLNQELASWDQTTMILPRSNPYHPQQMYQLHKFIYKINSKLLEKRAKWLINTQV